MFSTFTKHDDRALLVRTQDLRFIEDVAGGDTEIGYEVAGVLHTQSIQGTATENLERLRAEELAAMAFAQRLQQREQSGLPLLPIKRGRQ